VKTRGCFLVDLGLSLLLYQTRSQIMNFQLILSQKGDQFFISLWFLMADCLQWL